MTVPVVQGTPVPSSYAYEQQSPYVVAEEYNNYPIEPQKKFQDVPWAVLFIGHLIAMLAILSLNIAGAQYGGGSSYGGLVWFIAVIAIVSIAVSCASLSLMMKFPTEIVKTALVFSVIMSLLMAVFGFMSGQILFGVMGLVMFAIGVCYAKTVWAR